MSTITESARISFLQVTWRALLEHRPEPFSKSLLTDFLSTSVMRKLPEHTTLLNVMMECSAQGAYEESYIKSFFSIQKTWRMLTPEARQAIIQTMHSCGLRDKTNTRMFQLLEDDEAALTIQWDVADRLYAQIQASAFKVCRELGLEMEQPRATPRDSTYPVLVRKSQGILLAILKEKIKIDSTAITMAVGYMTPVAKTRIMNRLNGAYLELLDAGRAGLFHFLQHNLQALSGIPEFQDAATPNELTALQESVLREHVDASLRDFKQEYEQLRKTVERLPPDPTIYDKARRFFDGKSTLH